MMRGILLLVCMLGSTLCIPLDQFYPFGASEGDRSVAPNDDGSSPDVPINSSFPFFNHQHGKLIVNTNGAISFLGTLSQYTPNPFPLSSNRRIITPFWADVDIRKGGNIWYRESTSGNLLSRASDEIRTYFSSQPHFKATWIFVATWDNVAFFGCNPVACPRGNTFQAILITDGLHSFTVFNYNETRWTTGTASQGNAITGLGGTPAQVGFDAGNGMNYYAVNASRTPDIININTMSNINKPGKFAFRIDTATIEQGGCNSNGDLTIVPQYLSMLGGQTISIGGPCLDPSDVLKIKFNNRDERVCQRVNENRLTCITPMFYTTNDISVTVTIMPSNGQSTSFTGTVTPVNLANTNPKIVRNNPNYWQKGRRVTISWNAMDLPSYSHADIDIFVLKVVNGVLRWQHSTTVLTMVPLTDETASFILNIPEDVAVIRLSPHDNNVIKEAIWSDVFPVIPSQSQEADNHCANWESKDIQLPSIANTDIQPCPCTLEQALVDTSRFNRDPACNQFRENDGTGSSNCLYNRGAKHCVRLSAQRQDGVGVSCCYGNKGEFIDPRRETGGGMMQRYNYIGNNADNIPYLSNFFYDVSPYLQCCYGRYHNQSGFVFSNLTGGQISQPTGQCERFFERRPPSDCRGYTPSALAFANGVPHMVTLDGLSYMFIGVGEYTLLKDLNNTFKIDVRMEQFKNDRGEKTKASVFTSLVARSKNISDTVEVTLNQIRTADVLINGNIVDFTEAQWLDFRGLSVQVSNVNESGSFSKEILITFEEPSVAVKVIANKYLMNIITFIGTESLKGSLEGLLGDFDGEKTNDLKPKNEDPIPYNSSMEDIHKHFGETWRIHRNDSLFTYPIGESYSSFQNPTFVPEFNLSTAVSNKTREICGDDLNCIYVFHTTGMIDIAKETAKMNKTIVETQAASRTVSSCGVPPVIRGGTWDTNGLIEGSTGAAVCNGGSFLEHNITIQCTKDGKWMADNIEINEMSCLTGNNQVVIASTTKERKTTTIEKEEITDTTTPAVTLERHDISCDDDSITAFIPEDLLPAGVTLEWRDRSCSITENSTHFVSTISHSGCGTSVNMTTDSVIFENEITVSTSTNVSGLVDFGGSVSVIPVRCVYPRKELSVVSYLPNNAPRFFEKRTGHFKLNMELYETSQFQNAIQNLPAKVRLQSDVNIRVSLSGNLGQFGLRLEKCMATKSPAPYDVNVYRLIEHGCPVQTHVKILNSPTTEVRFTMKAFEFTNSASAEVYIHCEASVCAAGAPECISNCANSVGRRRRDLSHQSHLVSAGPVLVQATEDNSKEKVTTVLTGVFGVVALGAVVLAIIGWRRKPAVKSVDYS